VSSSINDSKRVKRIEDDGRSGHPKIQRGIKIRKCKKSCSETEAKNSSRFII
jgi:hypothetical protein